MDAMQQTEGRGRRRNRHGGRVAKGLIGALIAAGLVFVGILPANAAGAFSRTIQPLGCFSAYTVSGGSYATSGGASAFTSRTSVVCAVIPWQDVGVSVRRGSSQGPYRTGAAFVQSTVRGSGSISGNHYYKNGADRITT